MGSYNFRGGLCLRGGVWLLKKFFCRDVGWGMLMASWQQHEVLYTRLNHSIISCLVAEPSTLKLLAKAWFCLNQSSILFCCSYAQKRTGGVSDITYRQCADLTADKCSFLNFECLGDDPCILTYCCEDELCNGASPLTFNLSFYVCVLVSLLLCK